MREEYEWTKVAMEWDTIPMYIGFQGRLSLYEFETIHNKGTARSRMGLDRLQPLGNSRIMLFIHEIYYFKSLERDQRITNGTLC